MSGNWRTSGSKQISLRSKSMMLAEMALPGTQVANMYGIFGMNGIREYSVGTGRKLKRTLTYQGSLGGAE
jgi:hypothetical protein